MDILWLLVPLSVLIALGIGAMFVWSARSGQFDDLEGPAHRVMMDDDRAPAAVPDRKAPGHDAT
jgi:cbb3-type cytochrome oxidase maturation protein